MTILIASKDDTNVNNAIYEYNSFDGPFINKYEFGNNEPFDISYNNGWVYAITSS